MMEKIDGVLKKNQFLLGNLYGIINVKQHEQEGEIISIQVIKNDQFTTMSSIRQRKTIKPDSSKTKTSQSSGKQPFKDENNFTSFNLVGNNQLSSEFMN